MLNQADIDNIKRAIAEARQALQALRDQGGTAQQQEIIAEANSDMATVAGTIARL